MVYAHLLTVHRTRVMNVLDLGLHVIDGKNYDRISPKRDGGQRSQVAAPREHAQRCDCVLTKRLHLCGIGCIISLR